MRVWHGEVLDDELGVVLAQPLVEGGQLAYV